MASNDLLLSFPNDIVHNIMEKLPLKSIVRSKLFNKEWQNCIRNSDFVQHHLKHSLKNSENNALLFLRSGTSLYFVDDLSISPPRPINLPIPSTSQYISIVGSCNGVICIEVGSFSKSYILINPTNPTVFETIDFSLSHIFCNVKLKHNPNFFVPIVSGFGYDDKNDDYKIVYIWSWKNDKNSVKIRGMIYCLKLGKWKTLHPPNVGTSWNYCGIVNNCLHFVTESNNVIISFDLHEEKWGEVNFPDIKAKYEVKEVSIFEGCLSVLIKTWIYHELWVMKQYGITKSWTRLLILPIPETCRVLFYSTRVQKYLLSVNCRRLVWYNEVDESIEEVKIDGKLDIDDFRMVIGSLVPIQFKMLDHHLSRERKGLFGGQDDGDIGECREGSKQRRSKKCRTKTQYA